MSHTPGPWDGVLTGINPPSWNVWADAIEDEDGTRLRLDVRILED